MIVVMLPAYNEEQALPGLLERFERVLSGQAWRVVVVDDGSNDGTVDRMRQCQRTMPVELVSHVCNVGLGAAMRSGLRFVADSCDADDVIVTMDADGTHDPALVSAMKLAIDAGNDIVIASRYAPGGREVGLEMHRKVLSRGASGLLKRVFPVTGVRDYTCGYRMYRATVIQRGLARYGDQLIVENSFVCMAELLIKLAYLPASVTEVPLVLRYDLKQGASKLKKLHTIIRYMRFILREKRRGLRAPPDRPGSAVA